LEANEIEMGQKGQQSVAPQLPPTTVAAPPALFSTAPISVSGKRPEFPWRHGVPTKAEGFDRALAITAPAASARGTWRQGDRVSLAYFDNRVLV